MQNTKDETRKYLESVRDCKLLVKQAEHRLEALMTRATRITPTLSDMPKGGGGDDHKDSVILAMMEQKKHLEDARSAWLARIIEVQDFIDKLESTQQRIILDLRYVDLMRWEDILEESHKFGMTYDMRQIYRIHGDALTEARKLWKELHANEDMDRRSAKNDKQELEE